MLDVRLSVLRIRNETQQNVIPRSKVRRKVFGGSRALSCNTTKGIDRRRALGLAGVRVLDERVEILHCLAGGQTEELDLVGLRAIVHNLECMLPRRDCR